MQTNAFKQLTSEEQRLANIFFDHFYNRIVHYSNDPKQKVNVPFNFRSPEQWREIFDNMGLEKVYREYIGIDHPIVPEYHLLDVLEVSK